MREGRTGGGRRERSAGVDQHEAFARRERRDVRERRDERHAIAQRRGGAERPERIVVLDARLAAPEPIRELEDVVHAVASR